MSHVLLYCIFTALPAAERDERQLIGFPLHMCPEVLCAQLTVGCSVPLQISTFQSGDLTCQGCPFCPDGASTSLESKKRQLFGLHLHMCPMVMCAQLDVGCSVPMEMSTYQYGNLTCQGCPFCPAGATTSLEAKRQLVHILPVMCPQIMCLDVVLDCEQPETHTFTINGHTCYGCPSCPLGSTGVVAKREETRSILPILPIRICPIVECAFLLDYQDCTEPLQQHTMTINGVVCPGCPYCPLSTSAIVKRDAASAIGIAFPVCPMVDCAFMLGWESCSTPLQQHTMIINGVECPGCPYCADNILVGAAVSKRQHLFPLCPVVDCFFPVNECSQPVKIGTISVGGHECPGCPYCPDDDTSTTAAP